ncbi:uncharacterized protein [Rutidosis leptorrhynchoides]|uniref:uncharacterized protein n=1 Tax=Rutidosis leptorrhynchoides TaxID=125765 RepID=UPI003A99532B
MKLNLQEMDSNAVGDHYQILQFPHKSSKISNHENVRTTSFMKIINEECNSSTTSSSIGDNSDEENSNEEYEADAQSCYKNDHNKFMMNNKISNGSIDDAIQALEEALPVRRGISTFYSGKSKSFTCLADVWPSSTPSIKDIAKPENAYTRKRRNLLASTLLSTKNKNRGFNLSNINTGRITKKPTTTTLRVASENEGPNSNRQTSQPQLSKQLLKTQNLSSMRSFSMVNLHQCNSRFGVKSTEIKNC